MFNSDWNLNSELYNILYPGLFEVCRIVQCLGYNGINKLFSFYVFSSSACQCLFLLHLCYYKSCRPLQGFFFNFTTLKLYLSQVVWSNYQKKIEVVSGFKEHLLSLMIVMVMKTDYEWIRHKTGQMKFWSSLKLSQVSNNESDVSNKTSGENNRTIGRPKVNEWINSLIQ